MIGAPTLEVCPEQPCMAVRTQASMQELPDVIPH